MTTPTISKFVENIQPLMTEVESLIEKAINEGKNAPITKIAKDLAPKYDIEWTSIYGMVRIYLRSRDDLKLGGGPGGGVRRKQDPSKQ